jgi:hypothetical protein
VKKWIDNAFSENDSFSGGKSYGSNQLIAIHFLLRQKAQHEQFGHTAHEGWVWFWHGIVHIPSVGQYYT